MKFEVKGMTCGHCAAAVRDALRAVDADAPVEVDLATGVVDVGSTKSRDDLAAAIRAAGYATV